MILEAFEKTSDAIEEVNERVVARANILGRLVIVLTIKGENSGGRKGRTDHKEHANTTDDGQIRRESLEK
jgi:hypothetical protein